MNLDSKVYIAGHKGLVGSAILRILKSRGFINLITATRQELDLVNQSQVKKFFQKEKPDYVVLAAAKVGGIYANNNFPADFIYQNLMIESNLINSAYENGVQRLLFLGSTCIYPRDADQPIREESLLNGALEPTNEPYALAKIAGIKLCESYNRQFGSDFRSVMPTNLYGINDNFHPTNSHVIPALIQRFHNAKINNQSKVEVWGSGKAFREFLFVDDMAEASVFVLELDKETYKNNTSNMLSHINIGSGIDYSIKEVAEIIREVVEFDGEIEYDISKPDGPIRKLTDISLITKMGWRHKIGLKEGLGITYNWFLDNKI